MNIAVDHTPGDRFQFGPFELRVTERLLLHKGAPLSLGGRAMDVLICLLERRGDVVSPEELLDRAWRGINVDPTALRMQVRTLRQALAAADPGILYVSNIAGRGYRFAAPLTYDPAAGPTPAGAPVGLPAALQRMIGREAAVAALRETVLAERLVTVVGPAGLGKTTVAIATAHGLSDAFGGDVSFVDLGIERRDSEVAGAVCAALRLTLPGGDPLAGIVSQLSSRRLLLILDSCEHVIDGVARLAEAIWRNTPHVHILATSREPLNVGGEQRHRLPPLETPPPSRPLSSEAVWAYPAVRLFLDRMAAGGSQIEPQLADAELVADICRRLDGIPLAIELAAGQVEAFGLATTLSLLDNRLQLSWPGRRTAPSRQVTLKATLDWSYDLLSPENARVLRALAAFVGPFRLDDAVAVVGGAARGDVANALDDLTSKSLVSLDGRRFPVQYRLLDTTRDYARFRLEDAGEVTAVSARHAAWALDVLKAHEAQLDLHPMLEWLAGVHGGLQEAQAALAWSLSAGGDPAFAPLLTLAAAPVWTRIGRAVDCGRRIESALNVVAPDSREELALNIALVHALVEIPPQDVARIREASTRARQLAKALGDPVAELRAQWGLWNAWVGEAPNIPKARDVALGYEALAAAHGGPLETMNAERMVAVAAHLSGDFASARDKIERALGLSPNWSVRARVAWHASDPDVLASIIMVSLLWVTGMPETAWAVAHDTLDRSAATGNPTTQAIVLSDACSALALNVGDWAATERYAAMLDDCIARGASAEFAVWTHVLRATVAARHGDPGPGRDFVSGTLPPECGHPRYASPLLELAQALAAAGAKDVARTFSERLVQRIAETGERWILSEALRVQADLTTDPTAAEGLLEDALGLAQQQGARAWALRAATSLSRRRPTTAEELLRPLLDGFAEGAQTRDLQDARSVLGASVRA